MVIGATTQETAAVAGMPVLVRSLCKFPHNSRLGEGIRQVQTARLMVEAGRNVGKQFTHIRYTDGIQHC